MQQKAGFGYFEDVSVQVLEMPYVGQDLSMIVLLPKKVGGLAEMERTLSVERLAALQSSLHVRDVITYIPKFKLDTSFGLKPTLEALGMKLAFTPHADFSGISTQEELSISAVIHKAFVAVDEQGTEAAAATGVVMRASAVRRPVPIPTFRADHPFLFMICDKKSDSILFMGRMIEPEKNSAK